jgi:DNA-binding transcriptional MerR regulator
MNAMRYSIGDLCAEFDVTARALRHYENKGLVRPARNGRARSYDEADRTRLAAVLRAKRAGFALDEIRELLDLEDIDRRDRGGLARLSGRLAARADDLRRRRADIDKAIGDLEDAVAWLKARLAEPAPEDDLKARAAAYEALARSYLLGDGAGAAGE